MPKVTDSQLSSMVERAEELVTGSAERETLVICGHPSQSVIDAQKERFAAERGIPIERVDVFVVHGADEEYDEPLPYAGSWHGDRKVGDDGW